MDRAPDLVPKRAAESSRSPTATRVPAGSESAAGSQSGPAFSGGVPEPAAPPSRSGSAVAPDPVWIGTKSTPASSSSSAPLPAAMSRSPHVRVCIVCRTPGATLMHGLHGCATCSLEDSNAAKLIVHRCPQTSQVVLDCPGPLREAGPGWKLVQVEPDGNCLFATMMLGKWMVLDRAPVPSDPVRLKIFIAKAATSCRAQYLEHVREKQHEFKLGGLALQQIVQSSTSMNTEEYLTHMWKPSGRSS